MSLAARTKSKHTLGASGPIGYNVGGPNYFNASGMMANRLFEATIIGTPTLTALGYPTAGNQAVYVVVQAGKIDWWSYKPGVYVIKGTGTGANIIVDGAGTTVNQTPALSIPFRYTFTLPTMPAPTGDGTITVTAAGVITNALRVIVGTGGSADMTDLWVGHIDDEAKYGGTAPADYFTVDCINDFSHPTHGPLRMMNWQQMTGAWVQDIADIPVDLAIGNVAGAATGISCNSSGTKGTLSIKVPSPEMLARLAVACNMQLWPNANPQMTDVCQAAFASRMAGIYTSGMMYAEVGNEPWNSAYFSINGGYLGTLYGAAANPGFGAGLLTNGSTTAVQQALAHASLRWWKACETAFGAARVKKLFNTQLVNPGISFPALDYVDPGIRQTGIKAGNQMDGIAVGPYIKLSLDATANGLQTLRGVTQGPAYAAITISRSWMTKNKIWVNSQSINGGNALLWAENAWRNGCDMLCAYIDSWRAALLARAMPQTLYEYEGHWDHDDCPLSTPGVPNELPGMFCAYDQVTGSLTPTTGIMNGDTYTLQVVTDWFEDGDIVEVYTLPSPRVDGVVDKRTYKVKYIAGVLYAFATVAAYASGTLADVVKGGTSGNFMLANISRMDAFSYFIMSTFWSNPSQVNGQGFINYMHQQFKSRGLSNSATFIMVGSGFRPFNVSASTGGFQPWAMKPNGFGFTDTAALTAMKALT